MGQQIPKTHDAFPVLIGALILQGMVCELIQLFHRLTKSKVLHAYGV
jgi:hypothetical protein